jgi:hypothetical protein
MMRRFYKKIAVGFVLLLTATSICAQKNRFIYIQADNKQPFYVKLADQVYSSGNEGYLIISKLAEGIHELSIRFPKDEWLPQTVACPIKDADLGYTLKNFGDMGWGLINIQTQQLTMAAKEVKATDGLSSAIATDSFSVILASVVNDPGILRKTVSPVDTASLVKSDNKRKADSDSLQNGQASKPDSTKITGDIFKPIVKRIKQEDAPDGMHLTFVDVLINTTDTVSIFIPAVGVGEANKQTATQKKQPADSLHVNTEPSIQISKSDSAAKAKDSVSVSASKTTIQNDRCKQVAANIDFVNLRKAILTKTNDDDRVNEALKKFRTICFTTAQIKSLGDLFVKDEGKYKLYVAAYPFTTDREKFYSLQSQLIDEYFISRFKAMTGQ